MIGDRELIRAAMEAAGVEDAGKPRHRVYVNPRHQPVEEPAEQVEQEQQETPEKPKTTSTLPIPTGDPGPRLPATGGSEPFRLEIDTRKEAREHADRLWLQMTGQVPPTPISGPVEGRLV
ncbi:MAG: hypothetical protein INR66_13770 [Gordonia polyisoprenivorans]|nr:hypothetical protein [Gordonia polyisoprenivorans]